MTARAYPLHWPDGWPRTPSREGAKFKTTLHQALEFVQKELRLMGARDVVISSNVTLGASNPPQPGVAVYFTLAGDQLCIPCERYARVEHNLQAIGKTIEALRGIERWGAKHMVNAAFRGFVALSAPGSKYWADVLALAADKRTLADIETAYKMLARTRHPDHGGSHEMMAELNAAVDQARREIGERR